MAFTASGVVVPDHIAQSMEVEARVDRLIGAAQGFSRLLKGLDERLSCVFWPENAPVMYGAAAGRFNVLRDNSDRGLPPTAMPITTPEGGFREPGSGDLERLRRHDMWNPDVAKRVRGEHDVYMAGVEKRRGRAREDRRDQMADVIKSIESPGVSFSDVRWTARTGGKKGRK